MESVEKMEIRLLKLKNAQQDRIINKLSEELVDKSLELDLARIKIKKLLQEVTNDKRTKRKSKRKNVKHCNK